MGATPEEQPQTGLDYDELNDALTSVRSQLAVSRERYDGIIDEIFVLESRIAALRVEAGQSEYLQHIAEIGDIIEGARGQNARLEINAIRYLGPEQPPDDDRQSVFSMSMPEEARVDITKTENSRYSLFSIPVDCISRFRPYEPNSNSHYPHFGCVDLIIQAPQSARLARLCLVLDDNTRITMVEDEANLGQP